jgi:1-acyl-sn-glycerol-3-phosphate acyltransferase
MDELPQANIVFLRLASVFLGIFFKVWFRFTCRKDSRAIRRLAEGGRPLIVVFNHTSHLDVPAVGLCLGARFLRHTLMPGKQELFYAPVLKWLMPLAGVVPVKRDLSDTSAVRVFLRALQSGRHILLAPEGTRSLTGEMLPFHVGFVKLAYKAQGIILPVGVQGSYAAMPKGVSFPRRKKVKAIVGEPIDAVHALGDHPTADDFQRVAEQVRQVLADLISA